MTHWLNDRIVLTYLRDTPLGQEVRRKVYGIGDGGNFLGGYYAVESVHPSPVDSKCEVSRLVRIEPDRVRRDDPSLQAEVVPETEVRGK